MSHHHAAKTHTDRCFCDRFATVHISYINSNNKAICGNVCGTHANWVERRQDNVRRSDVVTRERNT